MGKRLINLKTIKAEKINRSNSHIKQQIADGNFPKPLDTGTGGPNLWDEADIDNYIEDFIAAARTRAAQGGSKGASRTAAATAARRKKHEGLRVFAGQSYVVTEPPLVLKSKAARQITDQRPPQKEGT